MYKHNFSYLSYALPYNTYARCQKTSFIRFPFIYQSSRRISEQNNTGVVLSGKLT